MRVNQPHWKCDSCGHMADVPLLGFTLQDDTLDFTVDVYLGYNNDTGASVFKHITIDEDTHFCSPGCFQNYLDDKVKKATEQARADGAFGLVEEL